MRIFLSATLVIALCAPLPARPQHPQTSSQAQPAQDATKSPSSSAPPDTPKAGEATIVFFRESRFTGSALKPSIYLDGTELDRLANGRWFSVHAAPGKHQLQSSAKNEPSTIVEAVTGQTTYVQMVILTGNWRGGGRLLQVDPADAQKVIAKLKPLHD